jgi:hypothetical protein
MKTMDARNLTMACEKRCVFDLWWNGRGEAKYLLTSDIDINGNAWVIYGCSPEPASWDEEKAGDAWPD